MVFSTYNERQCPLLCGNMVSEIAIVDWVMLRIPHFEYPFKGGCPFPLKRVLMHCKPRKYMHHEYIRHSKFRYSVGHYFQVNNFWKMNFWIFAQYQHGKDNDVYGRSFFCIAGIDMCRKLGRFLHAKKSNKDWKARYVEYELYLTLDPVALILSMWF